MKFIKNEAYTHEAFKDVYVICSKILEPDGLDALVVFRFYNRGATNDPFPIFCYSAVRGYYVADGTYTIKYQDFDKWSVYSGPICR